MDTASCFKKRQMNEYEKDLQKATEKKYENCDASFNLLKKENEVLLKHIEKQNKRNKDITDEKTTSVISVFHITITYTIISFCSLWQGNILFLFVGQRRYLSTNK